MLMWSIEILYAVFDRYLANKVFLKTFTLNMWYMTVTLAVNFVCFLLSKTYMKNKQYKRVLGSLEHRGWVRFGS